MATDSDRGLITRVLRGTDGQLRATYRVVLAVVAFLVSLVVARIVLGVSGVTLSLPVVAAVNVVSLLVMGALFYVVWVQRLDDRPLAACGIDRSASAISQFAVGFVGTLAGYGLWFGLWIATGRMSVDVVLSYAGGSVVLGVLLGVVLTTAGAAVQDLAFLGLIFTNAVAGLRSRLNDRATAVGGGAAVTAGVFLAYHFGLGAGAAGFLPPGQAVVFLVAGLAYFLAVYVYTGSLTAAIGAHAATNFSGFLYGWEAIDPSIPYAVPEVLVVSGSTPLTELVGPIPLTALVISFALLAVATRTPGIDTNATWSAVQE